MCTTPQDQPLTPDITATQQDILKEVYGDDFANVPQMWAMYKEVAEYYVDGVSRALHQTTRTLTGAAQSARGRCVFLSLALGSADGPVTVLFADDNWGNIMSVMPPDKPHPGGAGIYYHVDCQSH